jgi:DNA-binding GntR family transcriptional regulator
MARGSALPKARHVAKDRMVNHLTLHRAASGSGPALAHRLAAAIRTLARRADLPAGAHLAEQSLADRFQVSRSPIREALHLLEAEGLIERRPNRGSFLARPGRDFPDHEAPPRIDHDADYARLAEDRLADRLPPRTSEAALARRYGLSRSQILTLLGRMQQEGWVERLPGHGWHFLPIVATAREYEDGYRFRAAIEPAALLAPCFKPDAAVLGRLRRQQDALLASGFDGVARTELFRINAGFHEELVALSGNDFFLDAIRRVNRRRRLFEYRKDIDPERLRQQCRDHLAILDLVDARRMKAAAAAMQRHLRRLRHLRLPDGSIVPIDPS